MEVTDEVLDSEVLETRRGSGLRSAELTIKYSKDLAGAPYTIDINYSSMKQVLTDFGINPKETGKIEVDILRKKPVNSMDINSVAERESVFGEYDDYSNEIKLYADTIWNAYGKLKEVCNDVIEGTKDPNAVEKFREDGIIITGRLSGYLEKAPPERARKFVEELAKIGLKRRMTQALLHETGHKTYDESADAIRLVFSPLIKEGLPWAFVGATMASMWTIVVKGHVPVEYVAIPAVLSTWVAYNLGQHLGYKFSPEEIGARKFEKKFRDYPNLVTIKAKR
jgi:hypothetical protein